MDKPSTNVLRSWADCYDALFWLWEVFKTIIESLEEVEISQDVEPSCKTTNFLKHVIASQQVISLNIISTLFFSLRFNAALQSPLLVTTSALNHIEWK